MSGNVTGRCCDPAERNLEAKKKIEASKNKAADDANDKLKSGYNVLEDTMQAARSALDDYGNGVNSETIAADIRESVVDKLRSDYKQSKALVNKATSNLTKLKQALANAEKDEQDALDLLKKATSELILCRTKTPEQICIEMIKALQIKTGGNSHTLNNLVNSIDLDNLESTDLASETGIDIVKELSKNNEDIADLVLCCKEGREMTKIRLETGSFTEGDSPSDAESSVGQLVFNGDTKVNTKPQGIGVSEFISRLPPPINNLENPGLNPASPPAIGGTNLFSGVTVLTTESSGSVDSGFMTDFTLNVIPDSGAVAQ